MLPSPRWTPFFTLAIVACSSSSETLAPPPPPALGMNDVSVLVPLEVAPSWLPGASEGERGTLLPKAVFDAVPKFPVTTAESLDYARMRAIAVRFDGCFRYPGNTTCEAQIRIVFQPQNNNGSTRDSALHVFYKLSDEDFAKVVAELRALRAVAPESAVDGPLDVNPALAAQGVDGAYATGLRTLVLRYAGADNLIRETFFLRAPPVQETWFFGGIEPLPYDPAQSSPRDGKYVALNIVGVGASNQRVIRPETTDGYSYDLLPAPTKPENGNSLLISKSAESVAEDARKAAYASYLRLQNPTHYGPDDLPCAGCHLATVITAHAEKTWGLSRSAFPEDSYAVSHTKSDDAKPKHDTSVRGAAESTPSSLRAFGWFKTQPMIAHRVIFESAEVLDVGVKKVHSAV